MFKLKKKSIALIVGLLLIGTFAAYASLFSPGDFEEANGNIPYPGSWTFHYLEGPPSAGSGTANLAISPSGNWATLFVDGQTIVFSRILNSDLAMYQSETYHDPLGTVYFEFAANTPDSIIGTTNVSTSQAPLSYTWAMELIDMNLDFFGPNYDVNTGMWDIAYEPTDNDCGPDGGPADFASFSGLPSGPMEVDYTFDFDTNASDPNDINLSNGNEQINLERIGETNTFGQSGEGTDLGMPMNSGGDLLLDFEGETFTGQFEFTASTENNMEGLLHVTGSGGCGATFVVDMVYSGPVPNA